jgi:hypothetical protein
MTAVQRPEDHTSVARLTPRLRSKYGRLVGSLSVSCTEDDRNWESL